MNIWLAKITPEDSRGLIFGWALTAKSLGWMVAPLVSGVIAWHWGLRAVFFVNAGFYMLLIPAIDGLKTRDRLVDYFRYVEESVPFAKAAEARERGTAIVDGMNWLIREAGNSRLAVQAVKAQRNQLEAKLSEAQVALDASLADGGNSPSLHHNGCN